MDKTHVDLNFCTKELTLPMPLNGLNLMSDLEKVPESKYTFFAVHIIAYCVSKCSNFLILFPGLDENITDFQCAYRLLDPTVCAILISHA